VSAASRETPANLLEAALYDGQTQRALALAWVAPMFIPSGSEEADGELSLATPPRADGTRALAAYTSTARLAEALPPGSDFVALRLADLAGSWPEGVELTLNPGLDSELDATRDQLEQAASSDEGRQAVEDANRVMVGEPAEEPHEALQLLTALLAGEPRVVAAHRTQFLWPLESLRPQLAVGLEVDPPSAEDDVLSELAAHLEERTPADLQVRLMGLSPRWEHPAAGEMRARNAPFYRR
jgi:hypothetical protein